MCHVGHLAVTSPMTFSTSCSHFSTVFLGQRTASSTPRLYSLEGDSKQDFARRAWLLGFPCAFLGDPHDFFLLLPVLSRSKSPGLCRWRYPHCDFCVCFHPADPSVSRYHVHWSPELCAHNETARPEASSATTQVSR